MQFTKLIGQVARRNKPFTMEEHKAMLQEHKLLRAGGAAMDQERWGNLYLEGGMRAKDRSDARNTWSNRLTAARHWASFCGSKGLRGEVLWMDKGNREEKAEVMLLFTEFLHWLSMEIKSREGPGLSPGATMNGYARSIVKLHAMVLVDLSFLSDTIESFCNGRDKLLVDIRGPREKLKKNGITHSQMREWEKLIREWAPFLGVKNPERRTKVFRATYQSMFSCHWRRSDATLKGSLDWNGFYHLSRANVRWFNLNMEEVEPSWDNLKDLRSSRAGYAQVRSPPGKNDATGEGVTARFPSLLPLTSNTWFCPGLSLLEMEIDDPCSPSGRRSVPLFKDPETGKALSTAVFDRFILGMIHLALRRFHNKDIDMKGLRRLYSLHSFRIGASNALRSVGAPKHLRMIAGRWLSDAFLEYEREDIPEMLRFMEKVQEADCRLGCGQPDDLPMFDAERRMKQAGRIEGLTEGDIRVSAGVPESLKAPKADAALREWVGAEFKIMDPVTSGRCHADGEPILRAVFCTIAKLDLEREDPIKLSFRDPSRPDRWITMGQWSVLKELGLRTRIGSSNRFAVGGRA